MADLRAYQPSFTAGVLSPALHARTDLAKYASGLKAGKNIFIHPHGGASNRAGLQFINGVKNPTGNFVRLIPFQFSNDQTCVLEFGHGYMRVYKNGALVLNGGSPYEIATPYSYWQLRDLVFAQEADVMYLAHPENAPRKLARFADNNWVLSTITLQPSISPPAVINAVVGFNTAGQPGYVATQYRYKVASVSSETSEESLPTAPSPIVTNDLSIANGTNWITWTGVPGASRYIIYKEDNGVYGYIGGTTDTTFFDENIAADLADTPQIGRNPFDGAGKFPSCVSFAEQRLVFAATIQDPQAVWMSQSASYENFGYSQPSKASDAVTFRIKARQVNEIRAILPLKAMMLLTSAAEWLVSGGSQSDAITPSAIKIDNQGYRGCSKLQPVVVGNTVLFPQARGGVVRDFSYEFANDSYTGKDLTIMARHFFEGHRIVSWAYSQAPNSIVWAVLDTGKLLSLTYIKEHDIWGWTEHATHDGVFEDVVVVAEGEEDVPYFVVRRNVNGAWRRYIERLHTRAMGDVTDAFFVDSGLSYAGSPVTTLSGLGHLEGKTLTALADGNVVRGLTVSGGSVTLPVAASKVHIGLGYDALLETLNLDLGAVQGLGTVQGRNKSVANVVLRVENTRGIWVGPYDDTREGGKLIEYKQRAGEAWGDAIKLLTGDMEITPYWDWNKAGSVVIKQFDPLPMTILAIMPDIVIAK